VKVSGDGIIDLLKPCFFGPVMDDCAPIDEIQTLPLDFTEQYMIVLAKPYIVDFTWTSKPQQEQGKAFFSKITIKDDTLGSLAKIIKKNDTLLIDCKGHHSDDWEKKKYRVNFRAALYKDGQEPYTFQ
jgi:hypothetical protein